MWTENGGDSGECCNWFDPGRSLRFARLRRPERVSRLNGVLIDKSISFTQEAYADGAVRCGARVRGSIGGSEDGGASCMKRGRRVAEKAFIVHDQGSVVGLCVD